MSVAGINGAFVAAGDALETGSPGKTSNPVVPSTGEDVPALPPFALAVLAVGLALVAWFGLGFGRSN